MATSVVVPPALRIGEVLVLILGFGPSTLAVGARIYTKWRIMRKMDLEDYVSLLAWMAFVSYIAIGIIIGSPGGNPMHVAYLSAVELAIYCPIILIVKVSILLQYLTIFAPHKRTLFYYATHTLLWINILYYITITFAYIFECNPRAKQWDPTIPGHCFSNNQLGVSSGALNILSDFSILILPLPIIWRLQMSQNRKIAVTSVFSVGLFACITSIIRLVYSIELLSIPVGSVAYQLKVDQTGLWSFAEIAVGILVGCLPVLPRFFKHFFPRHSPTASPPLSDSKTLTNSSGRYSWLRFFRKSSAPSSGSDESGGSIARKGRGGRKVKSQAPQISTLKFGSRSGLMGSGLPGTTASDIDLEAEQKMSGDTKRGSGDVGVGGAPWKLTADSPDTTESTFPRPPSSMFGSSRQVDLEAQDRVSGDTEVGEENVQVAGVERYLGVGRAQEIGGFPVVI